MSQTPKLEKYARHVYRQATPAIRWYRVTVSTKDFKDHAQDKEFLGHRSSHPEQFTNHRAICNSPPSTSEGLFVRLTDSASGDYL